MIEKITEAQLEKVITQFDVKISDYEIINLEKFQGWSSRYLFLIVSSENYLLKAKSADQLKGYSNAVEISNALNEKGIKTRLPILTKNKEIFHKDGKYYWSLMTYLPGSAAHTEEYNEDTVISLAKQLIKHFNAFPYVENSKSNLKVPTEVSNMEILNDFYKEKELLAKIGVTENGFETHYKKLAENHGKFLQNINVSTLIHNDINPRNILIDHNTKKVVALIDWDHGVYGNPLKDISDTISIFYDYLSNAKANEYKKLFLDNFTSKWFDSIEKELINHAITFYYTKAKWQSILFYLGLLKKYGNSKGEEARFISEMKHSYDEWSATVDLLTK
ncbi:phosphotransferase [Patescibacteria group bacterium]